MKKIYVLVIIVFAMLFTGCSIRINNDDIEILDDEDNKRSIKIGELKKYNKNFDLRGQNKLKVDLEIDGGEIDLSKTKNKLFEGNLETNIKNLKPVWELNGDVLDITYNREDFRIDNIDFDETKKYDNNWDLYITDKVPVSFHIINNATKGYYDFTDIEVENIFMNLNASHTDIIFDEQEQKDLNKLTINVNAGDAKIYDLGYSGVENVELVTNVGNTSIDFGERINKDIRMEVNVNVGNTDIKIPKDAGVLIKKAKTLSNIEISEHRFDKVSKNEYRSKNYDDAEYKIYLNIHGNVSNISIEY